MVGMLEGFWKGALEIMEEGNIPPCSLLAQPLGRCQLPLCNAPRPVPRSNVVSHLGVSDALGRPVARTNQALGRMC